MPASACALNIKYIYKYISESVFGYILIESINDKFNPLIFQ